MAAPTCLVSHGAQGYEVPDGATDFLDGLPSLHAVLCICNVRKLELKSLLHAFGMGPFPAGPGLWAWHAMLEDALPCDRGNAACVRKHLRSCLVLLLWGSTDSPSVPHDAVLLDIGLLLSSVLVYASDEPAEQRLDRLEPLATISDRVCVDAFADSSDTMSNNRQLAAEMPALLWVLCPTGPGRCIDPADPDAEGGAAALGSAQEVLEAALRPELSLHEIVAERAESAKPSLTATLNTMDSAFSSLHSVLRPLAQQRGAGQQAGKPNAQDAAAASDGPEPGLNFLERLEADQKVGADVATESTLSSVGSALSSLNDALRPMRTQQHQPTATAPPAQQTASLDALRRTPNAVACSEATMGTASSCLDAQQRNSVRRAIRDLLHRRTCIAYAGDKQLLDETVPADWPSSCVCVEPAAVATRALSAACAHACASTLAEGILDAEMTQMQSAPAGRADFVQLHGHTLGGASIALFITEILRQQSALREQVKQTAGDDTIAAERCGGTRKVELCGVIERVAATQCRAAAARALAEYQSAMTEELGVVSAEVDGNGQRRTRLAVVHRQLCARSCQWYEDEVAMEGSVAAGPAGSDGGGGQRALGRRWLEAELERALGAAAARHDAIAERACDVVMAAAFQTHVSTRMEELADDIAGFQTAVATALADFNQMAADQGIKLKVLLRFCMNTDSGAVREEPHSGHRLGMAALCTQFAATARDRTVAVAVRKELRAEKNTMKEAYAVAEREGRKALSELRKEFRSSADGTRKSVARSNAELVRVRRAAAAGARSLASGTRELAAERAKARGVADSAAALRVELSAATARLESVVMESKCRDEARQCLAERQREGEASAATARQQTDAQIAAELTEGDKRRAALRVQLQQQSEEQDLLRARLAAFHESLCKLPPALQQRFFAPAGDADEASSSSSGFAAALSSFIDGEV